jgi:hypothetical protein
MYYKFYSKTMRFTTKGQYNMGNTILNVGELREKSGKKEAVSRVMFGL